MNISSLFGCPSFKCSQQRDTVTQSIVITQPNVVVRKRSSSGSIQFQGNRKSVQAWSQLQEGEFAEAIIKEKTQVEDDVFILSVDAPSSAATYEIPGQYVIMTVADSKPAYFAVASAPGPSAMEFLVKAVPDTTSARIGDLKEGGQFNISPAMGKGFQLDKAPSDKFDEVLIFAAGTGIAPIKAVIESGSLKEYQRVRLYYGAASQASMAYRELIQSWQEMGVEVIPVYSQEAYVQDTFKSNPDVKDPERTFAMLCGGKALMEGCKAVLEQVGIKTVITNY